jgi:uncharacterized protein YbjT (DUF2867 family)
MARSCAIAGASGLVGSHLLTLLLREYEQVAAVTRRPLGVSAHHFREMGFGDPLPAVDDAFCALGATLRAAGGRDEFRTVDIDLVVDFAKAAKAAGAHSFTAVSSVAADPRSPVFYLRVKAQMEEAVRRLGFERTAMLRPSFLIGQREVNRPIERAGMLATRAIGFALAGPLRRYRAVEAEHVARTMVRIAAPGWTGFRVLEYGEFT